MLYLCIYQAANNFIRSATTQGFKNSAQISNRNMGSESKKWDTQSHSQAEADIYIDEVI